MKGTSNSKGEEVGDQSETSSSNNSEVKTRGGKKHNGAKTTNETGPTVGHPITQPKEIERQNERKSLKETARERGRWRERE